VHSYHSRTLSYDPHAKLPNKYDSFSTCLVVGPTVLGGVRKRVPVSKSDGGLFRLVPIFVSYSIFDFCCRFFYSSCSRCPCISACIHDREKGLTKDEPSFCSTS